MDSYTTSVMLAPPGEVTNFHTGRTELQKNFINFYAGTLVAAKLTLALRLWTRAGILRQLWLDDYFVIGAWLMNIGFLICCIEWMQYGFGDHLWNVSLAQLGKYAEWATPVVTTYCWAPMLTKYLRLNPGKIFKMLIYFIMFMIFAYTVVTTVIVAAGCKPTDPSKTQCINNLALAQAILNIASDIFVMIIPLPMIYQLQLPSGQKLALAVLLTAGSFVVVASIIRLVIIQALPGQTDTTWVEAKVCAWSAIELNVGLMCNCLVVIKPLVQRYAGTLLSFKSRSKPSAYISGQKSVPKIWGGNEHDSVPLTSRDGASRGSQTGRSPKVEGHDILVTTVYTVDDEEAGLGRVTGGNERDGRKLKNTLREFGSESQEELAKRVRFLIHDNI